MYTQSTNHISEPDLNLIRSASEGNHQAFSTIVRKYENLVYSFAFKVCRNREKAEETLQDTFVNVYRKLNQFDYRSKFTTWLYSIVTNNCLMKKRRTKIAATSIPFEEWATGQEEFSEPVNKHQRMIGSRETPLENIMNKELKNILDTAIQKLPIDYRVVFVLRDIEGCSASETAKILKLSVPAVKSRLRRARIFLREQLKEYKVL